MKIEDFNFKVKLDELSDGNQVDGLPSGVGSLTNWRKNVRNSQILILKFVPHLKTNIIPSMQVYLIFGELKFDKPCIRNWRKKCENMKFWI